MMRLHGLVLALLTVFVITALFALSTHRAQASALAEARRTLDENGDKTVNASEVASWFARAAGGGSEEQKDALKRFGAIVSQFDLDHDGSFSDSELKSVFDALDEFPTATEKTKILGGDQAENFQTMLIAVGLVFFSLIVLALHEIWGNEKRVQALRDEARQARRAADDRAVELASIKEERERLLEEQKAAEAAGQQAAAAAAAKSLEANEARRKLAEAEADAANATQKVLETRLSVAASRLDHVKGFFRTHKPAARLGQGRFGQHGATAGFVAQERIFGSLEGGDDLWIDLGILLGHGKTSAYQVTSLMTGAAKCMKCYDLSKNTEDLTAELCALRDLKPHPNIMVFDQVIETSTHAFVLCELLQGKDLLEHTASRPGGCSEVAVKRIAGQALAGLQHLHDECKVVHNDIKPENIFVEVLGAGDEDLKIKIIDFGLACFLGERLRPAEAGLAYRPPEFTPRSLATKAIDMYRLGQSLYIALLASNPFEHIKAEQRYVRGQPRTHADVWPSNEDWGGVKWAGVSADCRDLIRKLLAQDPAARPTCSEALAHPWFKTKD